MFDGLGRSAAADEEAGVGFAERVAELALAFHDDSTGRPNLVEQIVAGAIAVIPGVVAAAVEHRHGDKLAAPMVMGLDTVTRLMDAQNDSGQGTCLDAWSQWEQIVTADVTDDLRWPALGRMLQGRQIPGRAVLCTPMEVAGHRVAVLTLVSDQIDFGQPDGGENIATLARVFAAHAAVAVAGKLRDGDLAAALGSRDLIGQAKGILMERFKITAPAAFAMLVKASADTNTKLAVVCERLSATGDLTVAPARRTTATTPTS